LGQVLQPNSRFFNIVLQKDLTLLDLSFFLVFFIQKKINPWHRAGHVTSFLLEPVWYIDCLFAKFFFFIIILILKINLKNKKYFNIFLVVNH
jgi:hypothetical protein